MDFQFQYRIMYGNGQFFDQPHVMTAQITMDEYKKIVLGVLEGKRGFNAFCRGHYKEENWENRSYHIGSYFICSESLREDYLS